MCEGGRGAPRSQRWQPWQRRKQRRRREKAGGERIKGWKKVAGGTGERKIEERRMGCRRRGGVGIVGSEENVSEGSKDETGKLMEKVKKVLRR